MDAGLIVNLLTPVIVPIVIAGVKAIKPNIPSWALPVMAGPLGVLIEYINHLATGSATNFLAAVLLGLAGVGVREVVDQLKPAPAEPKD